MIEGDTSLMIHLMKSNILIVFPFNKHLIFSSDDNRKYVVDFSYLKLYKMKSLKNKN